jgi:hypothetical protein
MISTSQCGQDLYVVEKLKNKTKGFYIEIGAYHPIDISNTYSLEKYKNWSGISFEASKDVKEKWEQIRTNKLVICDATKFDFKKCFIENNVPTAIDYLSLDIDNATLACLKILPLNEYKFKVITIEHDEYSAGPSNKNSMREILFAHGYILDRPDVKNDGLIFEDWWIYPY